jgi:tetratricopeptide (TPR) repeat protein
MAKGNNNNNKQSGPAARADKIQPPVPANVRNNKIVSAPQLRELMTRPRVQALIVAAVLALTGLFLSPCLANLFTNWDDPGYVINDPLIKSLRADAIRNIFSVDNGVMGNYHPLTILSYAIEYSHVRLAPWLYHFDSLLLHLLCTLLVYCFVQLLTRRPVAAAITALLFGLHPMHVESVAWVSGRKDVLYGTFYLAACILYIYTIRATGAIKWLFYSGVLILFLLSLLAKPVAVSLPLTLLLIDYFETKFRIITQPALPVAAQKSAERFNFRLLLDKIPFFALAIMFGIQSIWDQKKFHAFGTLDVTFTPLERVALGCYALITYLWKAVVPAGLSCFYEYPVKEGGSLPPGYYIYPMLVLGLLFVAWRFARKNKGIMFGLVFFLVNIALLLQFIPVGGAILADRYTYIAYIGLFFMAGWVLSAFFEPGGSKSAGYILSAVSFVYCLVLGSISNERCKVWYDANTLWRNEIEQHPFVPNAYNNLGFLYFNKFSDATSMQEKKIDYDSAYYLLNESIRLQPSFVNPYISLGELERSANQFDAAKQNYYKALSLKSDDEDANAYLGLAIIYAISHNFDSSAYCFRTAIRLKPYFPEAHSNYGNFLDMTGKNDSSLAQYAIAIDQNPDMFAAYLNRARELQRLKRYSEALSDFAKGLEISPGSGEIYFSRSLYYNELGKYSLAMNDLQQAMSLGFTQFDKNYYAMLQQQINLHH